MATTEHRQMEKLLQSIYQGCHLDRHVDEYLPLRSSLSDPGDTSSSSLAKSSSGWEISTIFPTSSPGTEEGCRIISSFDSEIMKKKNVTSYY